MHIAEVQEPRVLRVVGAAHEVGAQAQQDLHICHQLLVGEHLNRPRGFWGSIMADQCGSHQHR